MIALSAVQLSTPTMVHNAMLIIDTSTMADTSKLLHYLGVQYLAIIASAATYHL